MYKRQELKSWEVLCKLNNDSIIYASLPRHTEANMLNKNINDAPVSYTHLDVYKRQAYDAAEKYKDIDFDIC